MLLPHSDLLGGGGTNPAQKDGGMVGSQGLRNPFGSNYIA